ncbi:hypothetical protein BRE01_19980 [Brevibacillus reuszeri]|uniref:Uncharacterized protein n=1 Tax=Brevibacillus reuszeri TaxID=54915 RepID=A0A0K9YXF0_9BACL|nr:hypothetical protein [Brevibacillus reuszeri]KNB73332.1 hypothetical protein ADS79_05055 [Brevibacillus reuszeri]MED1856952.1 hypothetical protein [Brevibacillus reuszeri]GED68296.1 hypothetical protein BRE01_19980 [Brevibacillus reuszeri]
MSTSNRTLNQEILLEIMLQAYQLGVQRKDVDVDMMINTLTYELKPYLEGQVQQGRTEATG